MAAQRFLHFETLRSACESERKNRRFREAGHEVCATRLWGEAYESFHGF